MPINKVKGNMYDFIGKNTWNPLAGTCKHSCHYCYRNKMMYRPAIKAKYSGNPRLDKNAMQKNLGNNKFWFIGSMTDIFAENVPSKMIQEILGYCEEYPFNRYLYQSKNPWRFMNFIEDFPINTTLATTIESNLHYEFMGDSPLLALRYGAMCHLSSMIDVMITIEPIAEFDLFKIITWMKDINPKQINIGANTNTKVKLPEPEPEKIRELIAELSEFTTVKLKPNLKRLLPEINNIK